MRRNQYIIEMSLCNAKSARRNAVCGVKPKKNAVYTTMHRWTLIGSVQTTPMIGMLDKWSNYVFFHFSSNCWFCYSRFMSCQEEEEREARQVSRGCMRSRTCQGCAVCICSGCSICRFEDCSCEICEAFKAINNQWEQAWSSCLFLFIGACLLDHVNMVEHTSLSQKPYLVMDWALRTWK